MKFKKDGMGKESLPWKKQLREDYPTGIRIYAYEGQAGAVADIHFESDADLIVRAINCHDDLLAACKVAPSQGPDEDDEHFLVRYRSWFGSFRRAAIAKAEAETEPKGREL